MECGFCLRIIRFLPNHDGFSGFRKAACVRAPPLEVEWTHFCKQLLARFDAELLVDRADMRPCGVDRYLELIGQFFGGHARDKQAQHVTLAAGLAGTSARLR